MQDAGNHDTLSGQAKTDNAREIERLVAGLDNALLSNEAGMLRDGDPLDEMNLPTAVTDALVHDSGEFAPFLRLARHCEGFDGAGLRQASTELHLPFDQLNRALLTGLSFADSLQA